MKTLNRLVVFRQHNTNYTSLDLYTHFGPFRGLWALVAVFNGHNLLLMRKLTSRYLINDYNVVYHDS